MSREVPHPERRPTQPPALGAQPTATDRWDASHASLHARPSRFTPGIDGVYRDKNGLTLTDVLKNAAEGTTPAISPHTPLETYRDEELVDSDGRTLTDALQEAVVQGSNAELPNREIHKSKDGDIYRLVIKGQDHIGSSETLGTVLATMTDADYNAQMRAAMDDFDDELEVPDRHELSLGDLLPGELMGERVEYEITVVAKKVEANSNNVIQPGTKPERSESARERILRAERRLQEGMPPVISIEVRHARTNW